MSTISIITSHAPPPANDYAEDEVPQANSDAPAETGNQSGDTDPVARYGAMYGFHGGMRASTQSATTTSGTGASNTAGVQHARADMPYDQLPSELKRVLGKFDWPDKYWNGLSDASRKHLVAIYNRMSDHGLWKHVDRIVKVVNPERPALGMRVPGNSGSVVFATRDGKKLIEGSLEKGKFGIDPQVLAAFHDGQTSLREWSTSGDGLHLSVGGGGQADAHMDKVSPTLKPDQYGRTRVDGDLSKRHWKEEVIPDIVRNGTTIKGHKIPGTGIPGVSGNNGPIADMPKHPDPQYKDPGSDLPKIRGSVSITVQTGGGEKARQLQPRVTAPQTRDVDAQVIERITKAVGSFHEDALVAPSAHLSHDSFPAPRDLAVEIATRLAYAAAHGKASIELDFKEPYGRASAADQKAILEQAKRIAEVVKAEMAKDNPAIANLSVKVDFNK
jgi:hypothetical protein